jgi:serine/threonine protein kinase
MELPGFEIDREIGRGGMARVYLAVQKKFGRLVALKVVSAQYASDPEFRSRFLREIRINARLSHPNIVQVHDVGVHDSLLYLVLEYISGGDLNHRLERGMPIAKLTSVVTDIGRALDFAHSRGFIHRDIKPENILFREDDSAVLTDFGIAQVLSSENSLTRTGTVFGTPHYMSPEQAAGKPLDGRSDLYSLGVVFYQMLTGDVPYRADSPVAIGVMHLQEPIPKLPNYLGAFQEVIDRCLAKKPEQRYPTGADLANALTAIKSSVAVPTATIKTQAVSTQEIRAVGSNVLNTADASRIDRRSNRRRKRRKGVRRAFVFTLLGAVVISGAYYTTRNPDWIAYITTAAGITDDPAVQAAWLDAQSLHQDPNQSLPTIVAGYQRVLTIDPGHAEAPAQLAGLSAQWQQSIRDAIVADDLEQAETKLNEGLAAFPSEPVWTDLQAQLRDRKAASNLLSSTQALLQSHGLADVPSATAAIQAYQEVMRLAPGHPVAQAELNALAVFYAQRAAGAAEEGNLDAAIEFLGRASAANSEHPQLATARDEIRQATAAQQALNDLVQQARAYRSEGLLLQPAGENAAELYFRVLAADPDNEVAVQGLNEVVSQLQTNAQQLLVNGELDAVQVLVDRAAAVGIDPAAVNEIRSQLDRELARLAAVDEKLKAARELLSQGFITQPAGGNAVALLREVSRLDPNNAAVAPLLTQAATRLAEVAQEAHAAGFIEEAKQYLELALTVTPNVPEWRTLRESWDSP